MTLPFKEHQVADSLALSFRSPPLIPGAILKQSDIKEVALAFHDKLNYFISRLHDIACGKDLKLFILVEDLFLLCALSRRCINYICSSSFCLDHVFPLDIISGRK